MTADDPGDGAPRGSPEDEVEETDLGADLRRRVVDLADRMDSLDHYALLEIPPDASRKDVRKAYFAVAPAFHPDRYFGKKLGSYRARMEAVFARLTLAHDVLSDPDTRAEYDAYLATRQKNVDIEALLRAAEAEAFEPPPPEAPPRAASPETQRLRREILARKLAAGRRGSWPPRPGSTPGTAPASGPSPVQPAATTAPTSVPGPAPPSGAAGAPSAAAHAAVESLRRMASERRQGGQAAQLRRYLDAGEAAMAQKDPVAAANAYRLAVELAPDDPAAARGYRKAAQAAAALLAEGYLKQGQYEERQGRLDEAARSYRRAAAGLPSDAPVHERAALCLARSGGDLHEAAELAKRAVDLAPSSASAHLALAEVYLAAGLGASARTALDKARKIAPEDATLKALDKRLKGAG